MTMMRILGLAMLSAVLASCSLKVPPPPPAPVAADDRGVKNPLGLSDEEWRKMLTPEEYRVCRQQGTEPPGTGALLHYKGSGTFLCVACDRPLFDAKAKFESGTGWPSFFQPIAKDAVAERGDFRRGLSRIEVCCPACGSHLGHVFEDGPEPTGLRYCMNSVALKVREKE